MDFKKNENEKYKKLDARYLAFLMGKMMDCMINLHVNIDWIIIAWEFIRLFIPISLALRRKYVGNGGFLSRQSVRFARNCIKRGMLDYESNDKDKREKYVKFTEKGNKFAKPIIMKLEELETGVLDEMDEESRYWIFKSNEKFYELFNKKMKEVDYE